MHQKARTKRYVSLRLESSCVNHVIVNLTQSPPAPAFESLEEVKNEQKDEIEQKQHREKSDEQADEKNESDERVHENESDE